jgi:hypothetical protein
MWQETCLIYTQLRGRRHIPHYIPGGILTGITNFR